MNPALPVVLLLSIAPWLLRRGEWTLAWLKMGLVATLFLAPVWVERTAIPSPAATLGKFAPWQGVADPLEGNPTLVDVTFQLQPWQLFLRQQVRAGEAPFWNPHQFSGAPFWSNGQSAPLFPLHLLFVALPLQLGFILLPWFRMVVAGLGAWALAREFGVGRNSAMVAGVVFPLAGMFSAFLLFPMANALCLVPWVLRATARLANDRLPRGKGEWTALALLAGLLLLGGHPETFVHTAMLSGLLWILWPGVRRWRAWVGFTGAWLTAGILAAVQVVPLAFNLFQSSRWQQWQPGEALPLEVVGELFLRLGLPHAWGHPAEGTWWGPFNYNATAVFVGLLVLPLAWAGIRDRVRQRSWWPVWGILLFSLLAAYQLPGLRDLLMSIPVVRTMLHHRLLFAVDLSLGLAAAAGLDAWRRGLRKPLYEGCALTLLLLAGSWLRFAPQWQSRELLSHPIAWSLWAILAATLLVVGGLLGESRRSLLALALPWLVAAELTAAHAGINPALGLEKLFPETPALEFLAGRPGRVAAVGDTLRPNAAMVYGLSDIRGDDTLKLSHYEEIYRQFGGASPFYYQPVTRWRHPWLDKLATRWVLAPPGRALPGLDWKRAFTGADAWVYERPTAWPMVRWAGSDESLREGGLEAERLSANSWKVRWQRPGGGVVVIAETWDAGWRAEVGGEPREVQRFDGALLSVEVERDEGEILLRYRPVGFGGGLFLSLLGMASVGVGMSWQRRPLGKKKLVS